MYLKNIEVQGFKSFANKINFQFHNGITGIVGPNGSGKSNVADAVRWVLGEQRIKQLRGASMQDVIFAGTELRRPLSYAYVAITLDNSDHQLSIDYDEVTVARRLYRSGESEYLINGAPCRLKDINELFYDTGIGKEGYSIIGQGQIDAILSGKPEERRELFDEAAGIVKFKRRKIASEKKLEEERNNLVRVSDILGELEKQVGPLERQAEKAKVYLKKKEELKTLDVNSFLLENASIKNQLLDTTEVLKNTSDEFEQVSERYENIKQEYEETLVKIEELEKTIDEERNALSETSVIRERLESQIVVLNEQIKAVKGNEEHLDNRKKSVSDELDQKSKEEQGVAERKNSIDEELAQAQANKALVEQKLVEIQNNIEELNNEIEDCKNKIIASLSERANIKSRGERLAAVAEQIDIRKAELTSKLVSARTDEAKQLDIIKKFEDEFEAITAEINELNNEQKQKEDSVTKFKEKLTEMDEELRNKQVQYHQDKSKLEALANITERYEGYGGAVKKVMEQKDTNKGIIGVVADIIKADKKYEVAIETALGGNIQNIVTEDEDTAKKMIGFLKREKGGRATFLPLTSIKHPQEFKTPEVLDETGVLGMANELVNTKKEYANVAKAMLGRIVVVDNVDNAVKIAKKYEYGIRMVTLEGELLVPGGAISGGAFKNNSNLLSRRREMEDLQKRIDEALKDIDRLTTEIEETKNKRNEVRVEVEQMKLKLQEKYINQNTTRISLTSARSRQEENEADYNSLKAESSDLELQIKNNAAEKLAIEKELEESLQNEKDTEAHIKELQEQLEGKHKIESEVAEELRSKELEAEKIIQRAAFEQQNLDRIKTERERFEAELAEIVGEMGNSSSMIEEREKQIEEIRKTIKASHTTQSETEKKLEEDIKLKDELNNKQKGFFGIREELSERKANLDKEKFRLQTVLEKLQESIQSHIDYMWNEYEITLHDAETLRNPEMTDLSSMKRDAAGLRDEIKKLGDVNVNAIEEFKEVSERYSFLKTQHDDLVEAEKTLVGIIEELDTAMRKQFKEKFHAIEKEFDKVFKELFGGGHATLELMEDQDILEAGIKIIAQPPGKKLQNMMQLSGGEKALTAIALLFAIQNLKPSPFCLLDEIEAALDESNVERFAKYLHKLTKHTQFIVITHRRGTMERADRLYGITMQEKGVSTLVSVNLVEEALK
ncbi:MAG: chromosome segregation protein SMC [Lachnospiraceae bacterium]|nr:chromosome segregation protein SMC [Candidatus Colinaster scatohippi]